MGPKSNDECLYKRHKKERRKKKSQQPRELHVKARQRFELCKPQPKNARGHQNLEEVRKNSPLKPSEGVGLRGHFDF